MNKKLYATIPATLPTSDLFAVVVIAGISPPEERRKNYGFWWTMSCNRCNKRYDKLLWEFIHSWVSFLSGFAQMFWIWLIGNFRQDLDSPQSYNTMSCLQIGPGKLRAALSKKNNFWNFGPRNSCGTHRLKSLNQLEKG